MIRIPHKKGNITKARAPKPFSCFFFQKQAMSYDHQPSSSSSSSLELDLLRNETQNLKDEVKWERNKHANIYAKVKTLLQKENIPITLTNEPQQLQHDLEATIKHYTKVQKILALQVQRTEDSLAAVTDDDDNEQLQD
ncbi:unnamed protein product [Absidia cylindrospora]